MNIAVYCSAKDSIPEEYKLLGDAVGQWLAETGCNLVYGGATGGLMSRVSDSFNDARCTMHNAPCTMGEKPKIIGVIPTKIREAGRMATNCDEMIEVLNMAERKNTMREIADCFIVLPGSYGTLDELFDVVSSGTVKEHKKRIYVLNYNGFYNGLREMIAHMKELAFLPQDECYRPHFVSSLEELKEKINKKYSLT